MKPQHIIICLILALLGFSTHAATSQNYYANSDIGIKVNFSPQWQIFTDQQTAPTQFKDHFPKQKGPNDSPLLFGAFHNMQLFTRLLVEPVDMSAREYLNLLVAGLKAEGLQLHSARWLQQNDSFELEYFHPATAMLFRERLSRVNQQYMVRLAFWGHQALVAQFQDEMHQVFNQTELLREQNDKLAWDKAWLNLEQRLPAENMAGVEIDAVKSLGQSPLTCADPSKSIFWQAQGKNSTVYLFGSIHVGEAGFYPLHPSIEKAFRDADHIVVEVDIESLDMAELQGKITKRGMVTPGTSLADVISKPVLNKLEQQLAEMGLPAANFMRFKPWFLSMILGELQASSAGYISQYGIEKYILTEKTTSSNVIELESIQAQLQLLESLNSESLLAYTLLGFEGGKLKLQNLVNAWKCGDKETLEKMLFEDDALTKVLVPDLAEIEERMFFSRNVKMAEKIAHYLDNGRGHYFVTVGAGHLVGNKSIVELLRQKKHEVVRAKLSN